MGYGIPTSWNKSTFEMILLFSFMGVGKALGGILSDKFGIKNIAEKIGRFDIVGLSVPIIAMTIIISLISICGRFVEDNVMQVASDILTLINYFIYLVFLSKAKKMFDGIKIK